MAHSVFQSSRVQPIIENDDDEEEEVRAKEQVNLESKLDRVDVWLDNVECIQPSGVDFPNTAECVQLCIVAPWVVAQLYLG